MFIKTLDREITILEFSRKVSRQMQEELMKGVIMKGDQAIWTTPDIPAVNALRAEELAVSLLTGITQEELDTLQDDEYDKLRDAVLLKKNALQNV